MTETFKPLTLSTADLEFLECRQFQIDEICRVFGGNSVPRVARYGWAIPNRLYGAQINQDGDAV